MYTTQEVAELLGVSNRTIQLWASSGVLNAWKTPGGHRRFPQDEVDRLRESMGGDAKVRPREGDTTVLVLEDEPDLRELYRLHIGDWGLPVEFEAASDGYEGLFKIGLLKPAVIILDLLMPRMDGFRMLELLDNAEALRDSLLVVVTGLDEEKIRGEYPIPEGVQVYAKPIPFDTLRELISSHLGAVRVAAD